MTRSLIALVASPLAAALILALMIRVRARLPVSTPDHRTLHTGSIPRTGGIAVWAGVAAAAILSGTELRWWIWAGILVAVFAVEDWVRTSPWIRLLAQAGAALGLLLALNVPDARLGLLGGTIAWVAVLWMTNLYNFMDGADGLAGLMTVVGFGSYAIAAHGAGQADMALLAAAIALAVIPFLVVNWHPARIFLGDAGAVPLGFAAAGFGLEGLLRGIWPFWFPVLVFVPFILDASLTLARRSLRGHSPLLPHRDHCYQRLVQLGWGHARTGVAYGIAMLASAIAALGALAWSPGSGLTALAIIASMLAGGYGAVARAWGRRSTQR